MSLDQYLQLLDWTGRPMKSDKVGSIPAESAGILERPECGPETWVDLVKNFRKRFRYEAGLQKNRQGFRAARRRARATRTTSGNACGRVIARVLRQPSLLF